MTYEENVAPVYRYFTADLLTNQILSEIPFRGVNYVRALRGAGTFSGSVPVLEETKYLNLYEATVPGNTALYVVRDGVCVWGGIIWTRDYNIVERVLNVSASEFTSYLYHRRIWKTWNHEFEATAVVENNTAEVTFRLGSTTALSPEASVYLQFNDISYDRYNNFYEVGEGQQPTTSSFFLDSVTKKADIVTLSREDGSVSITTSGPHKFGLNDIIVVESEDTPEINGTHTVSFVGGAEGDKLSYLLPGDNIEEKPSSGQISRTIQDGVYPGITVFVRADTYDYIRNLITGTFSDFVGIDFPNVYIEPGLRYGIGIRRKKLQNGFATITTNSPHRLSPGQAVVIRDLGVNFDGEHLVSQTLSPTQFTYLAGGALSITSVSSNFAQIESLEAISGDTTVTTREPHNFLLGQTVDIRTELGFEGLGRCLNDQYAITEIVSPTKFRYIKPSRIDVPKTTFARSFVSFGGQERDVVRAEIANNIATLTTSSPHTYAPGQTVTVSGVSPVVEIAEKSFSVSQARATIKTTRPHYFQAEDSVQISGLRDASKIIDKTITGTGSTKTVSFTTERGHNFRIKDFVEISGLTDSHRITNKALTSNLATLTTDTNNNFAIGSSVTVSDVFDEYDTRNQPNSRSLQDNVATLVLTTSHNIKVNDNINVSKLSDVGSVVSRSLENKIATLTLETAHNFFEGDDITVAGVGKPFNGKYKVSSVTRTRVQYEIPKAKATQFIAPAQSSGTITSKNSIFNGDFVVTSVTSNSISYARDGNPVSPISAPNGKVNTLNSVFNGTFVVFSRPLSNTFTFAVTGANVSSTSIPKPKADSEIPPSTASQESIHSGTRELTNVTRNTVFFTQTIANNIPKVATEGYITADSIFNGTYNVSSVLSEDTFTYARSGPKSDVLETAENSLAYARGVNIYNGSRTITAVNYTRNTFSFARTHVDIPGALYIGYGSATVTPIILSSTFGPFSKNADIDIQFPTKGYSGYQVLPVPYRGFELQNVGEVLDSYSDNVNGFEYRIDCSFDEETSSFTKTFVIVPINYPDAPPSGQVSPPERFGAERLIFEYPGNIRDMTMTESAENASTRFFAVGENDLGPDAGPPISVASSTDLLSGASGRKWPLLDDSEDIANVDDELILYAYAKRYLSEATPPVAEIELNVNGSLQPEIGTYNPGDWCSVVISDEFIASRLRSELEPRENVILRKIESINVEVPDGTTFPEMVSLILVPEWDVDKRKGAGS